MFFLVMIIAWKHANCNYKRVTIRLQFGNKKTAEDANPLPMFFYGMYAHSDSSLYLAGAQAPCAGVYSAGSAVYDSLYLLYVGLEGSVGASV